MPTHLAARLREATRALHRQAEQAGVMRGMLAGQVDRGAYIALLRALVPVYETLESGLAGHPELWPVPLPRLARGPSLAADLEHLHGPGWRRELSEPPAARAYGERIRGAASERPVLLAAHAYVRYLGDLSGGQALGRVVAGGLGLTTEAGTAFYRFVDVPDPAECKRAFRAGLDALPLGAGDAELIVAEAREAFAANIRIFESITPASSPRASPAAG